MTFPQRAQDHEPALILARKWYQDGFALLQGRRPRPSPPHPIPERSGPLLPQKRFLIAPIDILALQGMVVGDCSWHGSVAPTSCPHFRESRPHHPLPIGSRLASPQSIASARFLRRDLNGLVGCGRLDGAQPFRGRVTGFVDVPRHRIGGHKTWSLGHAIVAGAAPQERHGTPTVAKAKRGLRSGSEAAEFEMGETVRKPGRITGRSGTLGKDRARLVT